ncbi:hypothetical protein NP493_406g02023 [Ridgeia piscesae]|uniref:EGF-like domain-containing protein n=1 Tax=Ridgeia piscesae TaxID=27915 RepID=A0AAD9L275_RIDPI|nr:hypothetical protein NP493_406g02023 [Ridgeia piscesae]
MCDCSGNGDCLFTELAADQKEASKFRVVACKCNVGYAGTSCADNFDGCQDNPCTMLTNCTDLSPSEQATQNKAFTCSECPTGYIDDYGICVVLSDVNECDTASTCTDIQTCTNTPGSYTCNCKAGYRMTGDTCNDINECNEKSSGCQQKCANTIGSFTCSCSDGYTLEADGVNCKQGQLYQYYRQLF